MNRLSQTEVMKQAFQYESALVSYAYSLCRDWSAAEDIVHEAYLVLMEKWESYSPEYSVYTWVRKMVYFKTLEYLRTRSRAIFSGDNDLFESVRVAMEMEVSEEAVNRYVMQMKHLDKCVEQLGSGAKDVLVSYYWKNQSCSDIAARLKRSVNSVWLSLSRIRKSLKECVERYMKNQPGEIAFGTISLGSGDE